MQRALLLLAALGGCAPAAIALGPADVITIPVLGRGVGDIGVSQVTGRDCSIVHLDAGDTYCAPRYYVPPRQPYCTPTLGTVTCWADPLLVPQRQHEVGYTPPPTAEQLRYRALPWPKDLLF